MTWQKIGKHQWDETDRQHRELESFGLTTSDNPCQGMFAPGRRPQGEREDHLLAEDSHGDSRVFKGSPSEGGNTGAPPDVLAISCLRCKWAPATHTALGGGGRGEAAVVVV